MHSSRMRTARSSSCLLGEGVSASVYAGIHPPGCGPGDPLGQTPQLPPGYGPEDSPPGQTPPPPPGCGPGDSPHGQTPQPPCWVWPWRPPWPDPSTSLLSVGLEAPHGQTPQFPPGCGSGDPPPNPSTFLLGVDLETCKACLDTTTLPPSVDRMTDTCKNITFANFVCER